MKKLRITVSSWDEHHITATDGTLVSNPQLIPTDYLYRDAELNILLSERQQDGSWLPQHIVLDPDFLVDVTTICRCFTHHGDAPAMSLIHKFCPSSTSAPILLGNVANQFLDDCVNASAAEDPEALYRRSLRKSFSSDALRFATTSDIDDNKFSQQCREMFSHIRATVSQHLPRPASLEAAFLCEALGIQGRMDMLSTDHHTVVELKSGKAGMNNDYRYEHAMQMALYKESLYYNEGLPYAQVSAQLFYARYPQLMDIRLGRADIHRAMAVRNGIVHLERLLRESPATLLNALTEAHFNTNQCHDRFYERYLRPAILDFLGGLHSASPLARQYFHTMTAFVAREQSLAKTGIEGLTLPAGHGGFADTWRTDLDTKLQAGRIIPHLRLKPLLTDSGVEAVLAETDAIDESSNFRVGDFVMLYEENRHHSSQPAAFYISCVIERFTPLAPSSILLRLRYPQHDASVFRPDTLYAIEPAHADSSYTALYRGLYAFLSASPSRQQLILGQRAPRFDESITLKTHISDPHLATIVLGACQARDYYLLIGPPGTGKTNVALRAMVHEHLASPSADGLLLMAFTNRAVDEICSMLTGLGANFLRIGPELSCAPEHRPHLMSQLLQTHSTRTSVRQYLLQVPIIVGTIATISSLPELFRLRHFRAAFIDEASQALEPHLLPLLCATDANGREAIDKFILIGDHKQLPAVVAQAPQASAVREAALQAIGLTDCRRSLFERLHELALQQRAHAAIGLLHRQGRMHDDIAYYASTYYYDGHLQHVPLPHQTAPLPYPPLDNFTFPELLTHHLLSYDVPADATLCSAKSNPAEAFRVAEIVSALSILYHHLPTDAATTFAHHIGIIVPFRGQITQIRRALAQQSVPHYEQITIDTVERYQGSQRDIIIFSTTVSAPWQLPILSQPVVVGGQTIDRKLNVALTRARLQFILVGNHSLLHSCPPYHELLNHISSHT